MIKFINSSLFMAWCILYCPSFSAFSEPMDDGVLDVPHITQLLSLPSGQIAAVTTQKGGFYVSGPSGKQWRRANGVPDVFIHQAGRDSSGAIYLATEKGLYRTDKLDGTWEQVLEGSISQLIFSPNGSLGLIKVWGKGLFAVSLENLSIEKAKAAKDSASQKAAMKKQAAQGLPNAPIQTAAILPTGEVFMGFFGFGIYQSRTAEFHNEEASRGLTSPWVLTLTASLQGDLYAGTFGAGLFIWNAKNSEWMPLNPIFNGAIIQNLAFGTNGEILAGSREQGLFVSLDNGRTWRQPGSALPGSQVQGVAVGADGSFFVGLWDRGLYVSTDQGSSWRYRSFAHVMQVTDLIFAPNGMGYAFLSNSGLYRSQDGGVQWMPLTTPVRPTRNVKMAVTPNGRLFLGSPGDGLWTSTTDGINWDKDMAGLPGVGVHDVVVSPTGAILTIPIIPMGSKDPLPPGLYERGASGDWRLVEYTVLEKHPPWSTNGEWRPVSLSSETKWEYNLRDLLFLPDGRGVASGVFDFLISEASGTIWRKYHFAQSSSDLAADADGTLYSKRMMSTFALRLGATEWEDAPGIPLDAYRLFHRIGARQWVAAKHGNGVDVLSGDSSSMKVVKHGLDNKMVLSLAVSPDGAIFAGLKEGIQVSRDKGNSWHPVVIEE